MRKKSIKRISKLKPPVVPTAITLPFTDDEFSPEKFELFCRLFVTLNDEKIEVGSFGRTGDYQGGADFWGVYSNGKRILYQCKKYKKFTTSDFIKVKNETKEKADKYILIVACKVSPSVKKASNKTSGKWDIYDYSDLITRILKLPERKGRSLVRLLGADYERAFYGTAYEVPFEPWDLYFSEKLNTKRPFSHGWELVGQSVLLDEMKVFVKSKDKLIGLIYGRGAIGKTKILYELSKFLSKDKESFEVFFATNVPFASETLETYFSETKGNIIFIVDDAHKRFDLKILFDVVLKFYKKANIHVLLSLRPYAKDRLYSDLTISGFRENEIKEFPELKPLSIQDVRKLAELALGKVLEPTITQLVTMTKDCPLLTLWGGKLLQEKRIDVSSLKNESEFRQAILAAFSFETLKEVGQKETFEIYLRLLQLIAGLGPIDFENQKTIERVTKYLQIKSDQLITYVGDLEVAGLLEKRGRYHRIIPDLLSDFILEAATFSKTNTKTGFHDELFINFGDLYLENFLRNFSELDWIVSLRLKQETELLKELWTAIEVKIVDIPNSQRLEWLELLEKVAFFQPKQVLKIINLLINQPSKNSEEIFGSTIDQKYVLNKVPSLLKNIAYHIDLLGECCDLLWQLGMDDNRPTNPNPNHPIRILCDLAKYELGKPLEYNQVVLKRVKEWIKDPSFANHTYSVLDVVDPLLEKSGVMHFSEEGSIRMVPHLVNREAVKEIQKETLDIINECARSNNIKVQLRALNSLENGARDPWLAFGNQISKDEEEKWLVEQLKVFDIFIALAKDLKDPLFKVELKEILNKFFQYNNHEQISKKAQEGISLIEEDFEFNLTFSLSGKHKSHYDRKSNKHSLWEEEEKNLIKFYQDTSKEFLDKFKEPKTGYEIINNTLKHFSESKNRFSPELFLNILSKENPEYFIEVSWFVLKNSDQVIGPYLSNLISPIRHKNKEKAFELIWAFIKTENPTFCASVALVYRDRFFNENLLEEDIQILKQLIKLKNSHVTFFILISFQILSEFKSDVIYELMKDVYIGEDSKLADEFCMLFEIRSNLLEKYVQEKNIPWVLKKIDQVNRIDDHWINSFLAKVSEISPEYLVEFLISRIQNEKSKTSREYAPLPHTHFHTPMKGISNSINRKNLLRKVRDLFIDVEPGGSLDFWIPRLMEEISLEFTLETLEVLEEWVESDDESKIKAVGKICNEAPLAFVFTNVGFVEKLLNKARLKSDRCYQSVFFSLRNSATSGVRVSGYKQPAAEDLRLKDESLKMLKNLKKKTPIYEFFDSLVKTAESNIHWQLEEDEDKFK